MIVEWQDCKETGIAAIDSDHRMVIDIVNELEVAVGVKSPAEVMAATLDALTRRVDDHFRREEAEFADFDSRKVERHCAEHREISSLAQGLSSAWQIAPDSLDRTALRLFAGRWLHHIHTSDLDLMAPG